MRRRCVRRGLAAVVCSMGLAVGIGVAAPKLPALAPGDTAPEIRGNDPDGQRVLSDYAGHRLTLVNFWATWCAPCREEMPALDRLYREHADEGLMVLGVVHEAIDNTALAAFLAEHQVHYPVMRPWRRYEADWRGVGVLPLTFLVDDSGRILRRYVGATPEQIAGIAADVRARLEGREMPPLVIPEESNAVGEAEREAARKPPGS